MGTDQLTSSGGGSGAFEDTDSDGTAELQDSHASFEGGGARNIGSLGLTGSRTVTKEVVAYDEDTDNTTTLNLELSGLSADNIRVFYYFEGNGGGATESIDLTCNNNTNDYYKGRHINDAGISTFNGTTSFSWEQYNTKTQNHVFEIANSGSNPTIQQLTGTTRSNKRLEFGRFVSGSRISSIEIDTPSAASGRIYAVEVTDS